MLLNYFSNNCVTWIYLKYKNCLIHKGFISVKERSLLYVMLVWSLSLLEEFLNRDLTFSSWEEYWWGRHSPLAPALNGVLLGSVTLVQEGDCSEECRKMAPPSQT